MINSCALAVKFAECAGTGSIDCIQAPQKKAVVLFLKKKNKKDFCSWGRLRASALGPHSKKDHQNG
jgi:hypothetical protein